MGSNPFRRCSPTSRESPMKLEEVIAEIEKVSRRFPFILEIIRLDETKYSVKYLLMLAEDFFVQVYRNVRSGTIGLALVYRRRLQRGFIRRVP